MRLGSGTAALPDHAHIHPEGAARADHHHPGRGVRSTPILGVDNHVDGLGRKLLLRRHGRHPGNAEDESYPPCYYRRTEKFG